MAAVVGHIDVKVGTVTVPVSVHATHVGGYAVPVDPMDDNQCESCQ